MGDYTDFSGPSARPMYPPMQCCLCGELVAVPTASRMCHTCLTKGVNLSQELAQHCSVLQCCNCKRFCHDRWIHCEWESNELLALCLKKIKGLERMKLIEAKFNFTEPHSKRLKVQVLVEKEVDNNCIVQQSILINFTIKSTQCNACKQMFTPHTWKAMVQIRQKTKDKRHILLLEQIILRHNAHENVQSILSRQNGFDLHFPSRTSAQKFAEFVSDKVVSQVIHSKKLVTQDLNNNTYDYKYTIQVDMVPICVDDLVFLGPKVASMNGGISPFLLCTNLTSTISLLDPFSLRRLEVSNEKYWKHPFSSLFNKFNLCDFIILNIERDYGKSASTATTPRHPNHQHHNNSHNHNHNNNNNKYELVDVEIMAVGSSKVVHTRTHLGKVLQVGDVYQGYDIRRINLNGFADEETDFENRIPFDVILVRKRKPKRHSRHNWVLKRIVSEASDVEEEELLDFKDHVGQDDDMQKNINIYRHPNAPNTLDPEVSSVTVQMRELSINDSHYF